jgi:triosephosphate isomerase (TIM)
MVSKMDRKPVVGISLKIYMNTVAQTRAYVQQLKELCQDISKLEIFIFPSLGTIPCVAELLENTNIGYGAQNIAPVANGAFTGEYSIESLLECGGTWVELGHAERRANFNETDAMINQKVRLVLEHGMTPVLCIGESIEQKERVRDHLRQQLLSDLAAIDSAKLEKVVIAYEPVWSIGQAEAAAPEYVHTLHKMIRQLLNELYGQKVSERVRIIYGGSVSKENAGAIIADENVDGVFVGRFGHDPDNFKEIIEVVVKNKKVNIS